jgi:hypothetical protein
VNNFYSTDFAAFGGDLNLKGLERCRKDNNLGWIMGRAQGVKTRVLPSSLATRFDIDTPTDLMILKIHKPKGRHLAAVVAQLTMDLSPLLLVLDVLVRRDCEALLSGRVSLDAAQFFDKETACRLRIHVEERGMETREGRGKAWSILGQYLEEAGLTACFQTIANHVDAAIIDSRVLFGHFGLKVSRRDRCFSDLLQPAEITHPWVRMFTEAACRNPIPCILGGHTLVSGGLYALAESAWARAHFRMSRSTEELRLCV